MSRGAAPVHSHSPGLALPHKDGADSSQLTTPSHSFPFSPINGLSSDPRVSDCWKWEGPRRSSSPVVFNWEPWTPPLQGTSGNVWRHFWLLQPGGGSGH